MFSVYCERKFEVEPVEVIYTDGKSYIYPDLSLYQMVVPLSYINSAVGVSLPAHEVSCSVVQSILLLLIGGNYSLSIFGP